MNKIFFLLLFLLLCGNPGSGYAIIVVNQSAPAGDSIARKKPHGRLKRLKMEHDRLRAERDAMKHHKRRGVNNNNRNGILSVSFIGLLLLAFAAVVIITPTIPDGLALLLFGFSIVSLTLSIVFGAIGKKKDYNNTLAVLGMVTGICLLSIEILLGLGFLALLASFGGL